MRAKHPIFPIPSLPLPRHFGAVCLRAVLCAYVSCWAFANPARAQGFLEEIDRMSRDLERVRLCEMLLKSGVKNDSCRSILPKPAPAPAPPAAPQPVVKSKPTILPPAPSTGASAASAALYGPMGGLGAYPEVLAYTRVDSDAFVEVYFGYERRLLRVGESLGGWILSALTDHKATFTKGGMVRHRIFRMAQGEVSPADLATPAAPSGGAQGLGSYFAADVTGMSGATAGGSQLPAQPLALPGDLTPSAKDLGKAYPR